MSFPFARTKPNPKRDDPRRVRGRVRLHTFEEKNELRNKVYERAQQRCERLEATGKPHHPDCPLTGIDWDSGQLAHLAHGARKTDTPEGTYWASTECHQIEDHNPKACPNAECLAQEVVYENDEGIWQEETPEERWTRMRKWVATKIASSIRDAGKEF